MPVDKGIRHLSRRWELECKFRIFAVTRRKTSKKYTIPPVKVSEDCVSRAIRVFYPTVTLLTTISWQAATCRQPTFFNTGGIMEFASFEEALKICLESADGSETQDEALLYCIEHAPEDLKEMLRAQFKAHLERKKHAGDCGCGCKH